MTQASAQAAVVKVFATTQEPDYDNPWQSRALSSSTGSGVVLGEGRVLTGAHVVANATFLQVRKSGDPEKSIASVASVCHDCDLALLETDPAFTAGLDPAELGELPSLRDRVSVVGFPIGGEEISITEGVVSRIEVQRYSHSQRYLLAVTVDAAINKGNSGGPVFKDNRVAGIAFQTLQNAERIGEMVPVPTIQHFLRASAASSRPLVPRLGIRTQHLENPVQHARAGLGPGQTGVVVCSVEYGSSSWGVLERGDVLLTIGAHRIANNGTIRYSGQHRTHYSVVLGTYLEGDELEVSVRRGDQQLELKLALVSTPNLVPRAQFETPPTYFIYGGLVFQKLTRDLLATWSDWWDHAPKEFLHYYYMGTRDPERQEVVVLTQILADALNVGYEDLYNESVLRVNGVAPRDVRHFVELVESAADSVEIETSSQRSAVFDAKSARARNTEILERYHIPRDRSADLEGEASAL